MIIIQLAGGLGNQMFQYALYLQLKSLGKDVKIDEVSGFIQDRQRIPALAPFGIVYEKASDREIEQMLDASPRLHHKIRRKLCGRQKKSYFEEDKLFKPEIFTWDDIYLEGYWQTEKYFESVAEEIKEAYDVDRLLSYVRSTRKEDAWDSNAPQNGADGPEKPADGILDEYIREIESGESVSVHIRGGDYLTPENQALFGDICTEEYYEKAMRRMREKHPGCRFYLFSNDKNFTKDKNVTKNSAKDKTRGRNRDLTGFAQDMTVIDLPENAVRDYAEFVLMSKCRHNIAANSSFSWWASYLNRNPDKTVYVPDKWLNGWDCRDFYRADMEKIR